MVLPVRTVDDDCQEESQRIDCHMPLAPGDLLSGVITAVLSSDVLGTNGLAVDDACAGTGCSALGLANFRAQGVVNLLPDSQVAPFPKNAVYGAPLGKIVRQQAPRTPRTVEIHNRVHDFAPIDPSGPARTPRFGKHRFDNLQFSFGEVSGYLFPFHVSGSFRETFQFGPSGTFCCS